MAAPAKRNLDELARHPDYAVKVQVERWETEADAQHRRRKDLISFVAVLIALGLLMVAALAVVLVPGLAPESKNWATSALSAIVAGGVGYLGGARNRLIRAILRILQAATEGCRIAEADKVSRGRQGVGNRFRADSWKKTVSGS